MVAKNPPDAAGRHADEGRAVRASKRDRPIRWGPTGTASASISPCFRPMPPRSNSACSTMPGEQELERIELPEYTDEIWHGYPARRASRHDLRLPGPWTVRAQGRASLQPQQAADRPLRQGSRRLDHLEPGPVRLPDGDGRRPHLRRARFGALHPAQPRHRPGLHLGTRPQAPTCRGRRRSSTKPM